MYDVFFSVLWVQNRDDFNMKFEFEISLYQDLPKDVLRLQEEEQGYFIIYKFDKKKFDNEGRQRFKAQDMIKVRDALREAYVLVANNKAIPTLSFDDKKPICISADLIWNALNADYGVLDDDLELKRLRNFEYDLEFYSSWTELDDAYDHTGESLFNNYTDYKGFSIATEYFGGLFKTPIIAVIGI